ncbi:MAG: hypothetical protein M1840_003377 [Geoglossum simile]|nr:MAG: hypothetical protein M1840_003377 [Geoglossum simile]
MAYVPRGLVKSQANEESYQNAQVVSDHESAPSSFWEDILHHEFEQKDGFFVNAQQPPAFGSLKRVDFIVSNLDVNQRKTRLMLVEAKRTKYNTVNFITEMERQLQDYCAEFLNSQKAQGDGVNFVYAMAVVGTRGRIFAYNIQAGMTHMSNFGPTDGPDSDGYWDATEGVWDGTFNHIKSLPPTGYAQM